MGWNRSGYLSEVGAVDLARCPFTEGAYNYDN
jgi:hypothetical protein